ncbi:patatin-like protein [Streptomyces canus]|uniref:patatin-like protein n=1 Tax=Streptomyces canus TaxID=58343 RepID=UPI002DDADFCC|nr:patatin-like protein [Streptomyces canus]WSD92690.1 patatin-like protein [Streptomyces canus]
MQNAGDPTTAVDIQDIRLAVVMNGGVSLAVWISGVTLELHRLATSRRGASQAYEPLLRLLQARARVDVIAGTSAGGINGAFLALGLARGTDIEAMRDLWRDKAAVDMLLRDPLESHPPSLLKGNDYFLTEVQNALQAIADGSPTGANEAGIDEDERSIELILTGTLWQGRETSFSDDMGVRITEIDRDALFRFGRRANGTGSGTVRDLTAPAAVDELAAASRCTSSFPAAFEPRWTRVTTPVQDRDGSWNSDAGVANFRDSQFVLDGGLLLNKPVRPALEAIYRQPAQFQVRRLLAYVVPDPGEQLPPAEQPAPAPSEEPPLPTAPEVLLGVLTRLRATDSVARELEEIRRRNADARARRRTRDRIAAMLTQGAKGLDAAAWPAYTEVRAESAARTIGRILAAHQPAVGGGRWSESELVAEIRSLLQQPRADTDGPSFIPAGTLDEALQRTGEAWDWGQSTVQRLRDIAVDVLKRAVWLARMNSRERRSIVAARADISDVFQDVQGTWAMLERYWAAAPVDPARPIPARTTDALGRAVNTGELRPWLTTTLTAWDRAADGGISGRRRQQYEQAENIARHLAACAVRIADVLRNSNSVLDPNGTELARLRDLYDCLLAPVNDAPADPVTVLRRMLRLEVVQLAFSGATPEVEQEVELIQVSATSPTLVTGRQLHHFGAFWRSSWRVNDWIHGRLDGAEHIVRMLLSPERLRQLGSVLGPDKLLEGIHACAVAADRDEDCDWLEEQWQADAEQIHSYLREHVVSPPTQDAPDSGPDADTAATAGLKRCIASITRSLRLRILREDLSSLAMAVRAEYAREGDGNAVGSESGTGDSRAWLAGYDAAAGQPPHLTAQALEEQWGAAEVIGKGTIRGDAGTDYFARTAARAAAVTANTAAAAGRLRGLRQVKPVATVLTALRGYALAVWAMVTFMTRGSDFSRNAVHLAVAVGGALLGISLVVPGVPLAFPLAGALVLTAGWSAAALRTAETRPVGKQLLTLAVLAGVILAAYVTWEVRHDGVHALIGFLLKAALVALVIMVGWWIARAAPPDAKRK